MNILVTGANGQLGTEIRKIVERNGNGNPNHNVGEPNYYIFASRDIIDITNADKVKEYVHNNSINVIINCAAYTAVDKAEDDNETAYNINVRGAKSLAEAVKQNGGVLIHISTDYVFNGLKNSLYKPDDETNPETVYGQTKRKGELEIINSGCRYLIFRTSWLYGGESKNFVRTMYNLIQTKDEIKVVNDQFGNPTYCRDLAEFIYDVIEKNTSDTPYLLKTGVYHFCNKGVISWYELTEATKNYMTKFTGEKYACEVKPCTTEEYPTRAKRPYCSSMDTTSTEENFGIKIRGWEDALKDCIDEYISKE